MDWKYKHFNQARNFAATRDIVLEAARAFMTDSLGWTIADTTDGFTAQGSSFMHTAIARFRIRSIPTGQETEVEIELLVERAGSAGFMLFDAGGYYSIQIRKWLDGIQWAIHQRQTGDQEQAPIPPMPPANKTTAYLFNGCLGFIAVMFGLYFLVTFICAAVGLITGTLYLWGRGGTLVIHGVWARIVSALILLAAAWIVWRLRNRRRPANS